MDKQILTRVLKFILGILLLPTLIFACIEAGFVLCGVFRHISLVVSFASGVALYPIIHYFIYDFSRVYVFMHEMTHALCAFLCGYHIQDMSVREDSGYVKITQTNTFVSLAPYFIPGYVIVAVAIYYITDLFIDLSPYRQVFLFLVGFFTSFHFIQTFHTLYGVEQPDLKLAGGKFFSVIVIVLANLFCLALVLKGVCPEMVSLSSSCKRVLVSSFHFWQILVNYILEYFANK